MKNRDKSTAIYTGTFDPFTNGHADILDKALGIFRHVTVLIAVSPSKNALFSIPQRATMIGQMISEMAAQNPDDTSRVKVDSWEGLIVDYAKKHGVKHLVRGLRPTGDFEIEFQMAAMNKALNPELETVFLATSGDHYFISSSLVKEIAKHQGDVSPFVPPAINRHILALKN